MNAIYNIIAELCSFVIKNCTEDFFVQYSCVTSVEKERILEYVKKYIPVKKLTTEDLTKEYYNSLTILAEHVIIDGDFFTIVGLIQILDDSLELLLKEKIKELEADDFTVVLNNNRETTGVGLLPRTSCVWERKHRLSHSYNRMDNFLFNLLLMENKILGELIDKHIFLKPDFFTDFANTKSLKIAASPLTIERNFTASTYQENKVQYFKIEYPERNYEPDNLLVWEKILAAKEKSTDILVFPEMLGNYQMVEFIQAKINELSLEEKEQLPSMIILPSYWKNKNNTVTILSKMGEILATQCKQNPFRIESKSEGYLEGIYSNNVVNIFHYEGVGRIAILICKDFLTTRYMERLMRCFKLTLIIVPSFSTGSYDFKQSFDLCAHDDCNVVWINTCAALEKGKEANFENIGYIRKRIGRNDDESHTLLNMPICKNAFSRNCNHDCIYFEEIGGV